ncbi:MAG: hypothetical protein LWW94_02405 [Candidatus Desulfofervidaceae bacterium]|nr:hypothetical protein [Candidatus Desulfofervidaceae bacterium]
MNTRKLNNFFLIIIVTLCTINGIHAQESHPFYWDIKEVYKESKLTYDSKVEQMLYSKLPKPQNIFERSGLNSKLPKLQNAEEKQTVVQTITALFHQFFNNVKKGGKYCSVEEIEKQYGQSPEEHIGVSSGGYYRLFVAYWTLKAKLRKYQNASISKYGYANIYYVDALLTFVETTLARAFFPIPGSTQIPESVRRQGIQELLDAFAPKMIIKELYEGVNPQKVPWPILK